jgi:hypothetical protein
MLPTLFFGRAGSNFTSEFTAKGMGLSGVMESGFMEGVTDGGYVNAVRELSNDDAGRAELEKTPEGREVAERPEVKTLKEELAALKEELAKENRQREAASSVSPRTVLRPHVQPKLSSLEREIKSLEAKLANAYYPVARKAVAQRAQPLIVAKIREKFQELNDAMQRATGNSYPPEVLERLVRMTADCLSMDPKARPTADQLQLALQDMGLADWVGRSYTIQEVPQPDMGTEIGREQARIQRQFQWINPGLEPQQTAPQ